MSGLFGDFNDANVLLLSGLPQWLLWCLGLVGLAILVFSWFDLRQPGGGRRLVLMALRGMALIAALALLLEPALELRHVTRIKNHVVFLVDSSLSMSLPQGDDTSRWGAARAFMAQAQALLEEPNEEHLFEIERFDEAVSASSLVDVLDGPQPTGPQSRILEAIEEIATRYPGRDLGGIVVVSDGTDSGVLSGRVRPGEPLDAQTQRFVESLGVPLHTVPVGRPQDIHDLAIERVLVDDFAFVRNRVSIEVIVRAFGLARQVIPVALRREGDVLQIREIEIQDGRSEYRVSFEFIPEQIGKEIYTVSVPVLAQETLSENNVAHFILKVIRDKIRVLQVCGRPSWDERFLRELLKRNPNVDLISFFILRTDANLQLVPNTELSLIPFPTRELFEDQLGSFDLVIFQNFTYRPYGMYRYLGHIADYVRDGGAFLMIGGEQAFASGGYTGTAVADVLPVFLPPEGPDDVLIDTAAFRPLLTEAGRNHPITQLAFSPVDNRRRWETLPELRGTNIVLAPRPEATVLLEHPTVRSAGEPLAVLAVSEAGEGRSMSFTSDTSWLWGFESAAEGETNRAYTSFWNGAIRWLIRDPELKLIKVEAPQQNVPPGEPFQVTIRVFRPDYSPAADVSGRWELRLRPLNALEDPLASQPIDGAEFRTGERGRIDLELSVDEPGAYEISATAELEGTGAVSDQDVFLSLRQSRELRDILPRPDLLEALSEAAASGTRHDSEASPDDLRFAEARTVQVNRRRIVDVWNTPWVLALFVVLLGAEWTLRRRWGRL